MLLKKEKKMLRPEDTIQITLSEIIEILNQPGFSGSDEVLYFVSELTGLSADQLLEYMGEDK